MKKMYRFEIIATNSNNTFLVIKDFGFDTILHMCEHLDMDALCTYLGYIAVNASECDWETMGRGHMEEELHCVFNGDLEAYYENLMVNYGLTAYAPQIIASGSFRS